MKIRGLKIDDLVWLGPIFCFGFAWLVGQLEWVSRFEWRTLDWRTQARVALGQPAPDPRIVVLGIGKRSADNIEPWPFSRQYHGNLQELMVFEKPALVVWDVIFANRLVGGLVPLDAVADDAFSGSTKWLVEKGTPVVFAAESVPDKTGESVDQAGRTEPIVNIEGSVGLIGGDPHLTMPFPGLREYGYFGFVDAPRGAGGIVRELPMLIRVGGTVFPSLSLQAAMRYWKIEPGEVRVVLGDAIYLGPKAEGRRIPIGVHGAMLLNFRYEKMEPNTPLGIEIVTLEYFDYLVALHQKYVTKDTDARPPVALKDKVVFVGEFSTDTGPSPRNDQSPLVLLHANALNNIFRNDYLVRCDQRMVWGGALIAAYVGLLVLRRRSILLVALFTIAISLGFGWGTFWAWSESNLWIPLVAPLSGFLMLQFGVIVHRVLTEQSAKAQLHAMFGSYLSPVVVDKMVASGSHPELGGLDVEITAYFSDIQGFSSFSEVLSTAQLVELLNEYLTECTDIVQGEGGTLDKFIGDAVVAMFGAPVDLEAHALKACIASQLVQKRLAELRVKWTEEGDRWPLQVRQMRTRIGLNTGVCMIGNMGSRSRFNYTMMGDNVNLAARMESGAKSWGVYSMVTESTRNACERFGPGMVIFRALGRIVVQGRTQAVTIFEIVGLASDVLAQTHECIRIFGLGLACYYRREWDEAEAFFMESAALELLQPGRDFGIKTNPSRYYLKLVGRLRLDPPSTDWDGTYHMLDK